MPSILLRQGIQGSIFITSTDYSQILCLPGYKVRLRPNNRFVFLNMVILEFLAATLIVTSTVTSGVLAVEGPFGFGSGTTGGASAAQAIPTSAAELKSW